MKSRLIAAAALWALAFSASVAAAAPPPLPLHLTDRMEGPDGGWDYVSQDPERRRLYFSRSYGLMALDLKSGKLDPKFAEGATVHAVVAPPGSDAILTTNSGDDTARVIDAQTGATRLSIPTGRKPDAAVYDPASKLIFVMNAHSGDATVIDPATWTKRATVPVGGSLEFAVADGKGRVFVNVEDANEIAVIDTAALTRAARYALPGCEGPTGMALNRSGVLISSCANGVAKLIDAATGADLGSLPIGAHPDAVVYDPGRDLAYIPCGDSGELVVIGDANSRKPRVLRPVQTQKGAKTAGLAPRSGRVYLPTATMIPAADGKRPTAKPGAFNILVLDR
jgi:YVTN family beta-propeller protein